MRAIDVLRVTAAVTIAPIIAWSIHTMIGDLLTLLQLRAPDWRFLFSAFYGYLFLGFVFAGVAAKLVPHRSRPYLGLILLGSVLAGVVMGLEADGAAVGLVIAFAVVAGAVGYGLRSRGFSEPIHAE